MSCQISTLLKGRRGGIVLKNAVKKSPLGKCRLQVDLPFPTQGKYEPLQLNRPCDPAAEEVGEVGSRQLKTQATHRDSRQHNGLELLQVVVECERRCTGTAPSNIVLKTADEDLVLDLRRITAQRRTWTNISQQGDLLWEARLCSYIPNTFLKLLIVLLIVCVRHFSNLCRITVLVP